MVTQQKIPERFWCVKQIDIFRDLAEDDANALDRITTFKALKHEDVISTEGVYLLKEGRVKIYETPPEGEAITIEVLEPGEIFGAVEWEERHRNVTAEVLTEATVGVISARNFQFFLKRKPHLAMPPPKTFGSFVKRYLHRGSGKSGKLNLLTSRQKPRRENDKPVAKHRVPKPCISTRPSATKLRRCPKTGSCECCARFAVHAT